MLEPDQQIGNYRIVQKLGQGGMGAVFEAVHQDIGRHVAIKVLHQEYSKDPQTAARFLNEARAAAIVDHPGIVDVFEFGRLPDGTTFLIMEYVKGESLRALLKRESKLLVRDALRITRQIAAALAAAHEKGIVHRDLKPDNVIIAPDRESPGQERAKVLDFGIAKVAEEYQKHEGEHVKTQTGMLLGTPLYMAPEQCRGAERVTDKADVYSLGVMLFQMLSGQTPFSGTGMGDLVLKHMLEQPPPLATLEPSAPAELVSLVHRMLAKGPEERPTMQEVVGELERLGADRTGLGTDARASLKPSTAIVAPPKPGTLGGTATELAAETRRLTWRLIVASALAALAVVGLCTVVYLRSHSRPSAPSPSAAAAEQVVWRIGSEPRDAEVIRASDHKVLGRTPLELTEKRGAGEMTLFLRRPGFDDKKTTIDLSQDGTRTEILVPQSDKAIKLLE